MSENRTEIRSKIHFILNDKAVNASGFAPTLTLLDYLRINQGLCGTKEGCAEGDCGACTVLVGRLNKSGDLVYESVNACIRFLASLDSCHVVTIEHLRGPEEGRIHSVQQAMVNYHGSQCGFCTPGIVMSLYALWMQNPKPDEREVKLALQGNLCRCTGYAPIIRAATHIDAEHKDDPLFEEREELKGKLAFLQKDKHSSVITSDEGVSLLPTDVSALASMREEYPKSTIIAGSTDVGLWATKHMRKMPVALFIGHIHELQEVVVDKSQITVGAGVSYTQLLPLLSQHIPQLRDYVERIGGQQVRNMGTIGGNIANGSPIGDMPPVLIALNAEIDLQKGEQCRRLMLEDFFIDYGKQDRLSGDFLRSVLIPIPQSSMVQGAYYFSAYKISKRKDEDISAVSAGFYVEQQEGRITTARLCYGGMAGIPKRSKAAEEALIGMSWSRENFETAAKCLDEDFTPLSDWRASAEYRMKVAQNLLLKFYYEHKIV